MSIRILTIFLYPLLYLDPGSGSLLVQALLAGLIAIGVTARLFWGKISAFLGTKRPEAAEMAEEEDDE